MNIMKMYIKKFYGYIFINIYIFGKIYHKIYLRVSIIYVGFMRLVEIFALGHLD